LDLWAGELNRQQDDLEAKASTLDQRQIDLDQKAAALDQEGKAQEEQKEELAQEKQRQLDFQADLDSKAVVLTLLERELNSGRKKLEKELEDVAKMKSEYQLLLWVLYGLLAATTLVLLVVLWLVYRLAS